MALLEVDERTAKRIETLAAGKGITPGAYIQLLIGYLQLLTSNAPETAVNGEPVTFDFDAELEPLLMDGAALPVNFSREDIYFEHD